MSSEDQRFMALALSLGRRGLGHVWPNPAVGCVLVREGRIVGRGRTAPGGRPHAETEALAMAGPHAAGATAYVTLEPCAHHGQSPPCADALIAAGVVRVAVALRDDDPRVNGAGIARLQGAGIRVDTGLLADTAAKDHIGFLSRITTGRPMVTLKLASSFDGRIATATGESRWITGPAARRLVHAERARHDAVLVGGGTARTDDPDLGVRGLGITSQPVRIVWSRRADLPEDGRLARSADVSPVWICHGRDVSDATIARWQARGVRMICVDNGGARQIDPLAALKALGGEGLTRVFCEGGGQIAATLLGAGLVDRLIGFTAGLALGAEGWPGLGAMGISDLAGAPRFRLTDVTAVGGDVLHRWEKIYATPDGK